MVFHWTPVSVAASQPEPKSHAEDNLTPPQPFAALSAVKMIYLNSLSDFNPYPNRGMVYLSDYRFLFRQLIFGEATEHLYTDRQYPNKVSHSFSWSICTNGRHQSTQVPTNTHADTFVLSALFWQTCRCLGPTGDIMAVGKMSSHQMATVWCHHGSYL